MSQKADAFQEVVSWHEQRIAKSRREIARGDAWAREHDATDAGTYYTDNLPREIAFHEKCARRFRRLAMKVRRAADAAKEE